MADTVEAMTSDRPYRKALSLDAVVSRDPQVHRHPVRPDGDGAFLALLEREGEAFIKKDQKFDIYAFIQD